MSFPISDRLLAQANFRVDGGTLALIQADWQDAGVILGLCGDDGVQAFAYFEDARDLSETILVATELGAAVSIQDSVGGELVVVDLAGDLGMTYEGVALIVDERVRAELSRLA